MSAALAALGMLVAQAQAPPPPPLSAPAPPPRTTPDSSPRRGRASEPPAPLRAEQVVLVKAVLAGDPPVDALRHAATALVLAEPARARNLVARARWAGWLPEVRLRVDRRFGRTESEDLGRSTLDALASPVGVDTSNDVRYEGRATWDLSRIIFNPDELGAESQALRMADVRREVELLVVRLYFERRRLKTEAVTTDASDTASRFRLELRVQEIEAELDAVTGGAFSRLRAARGGDASFTAP
jgi:hypothetical protein